MRQYFEYKDEKQPWENECKLEDRLVGFGAVRCRCRRLRCPVNEYEVDGTDESDVLLASLTDVADTIAVGVGNA